uniref:Uncharacterized protein n=1 Tax=Electrophorus electricus TaxID=8005 RepID=A0A4W4E3C4_ELEEL
SHIANFRDFKLYLRCSEPLKKRQAQVKDFSGSEKIWDALGAVIVATECNDQGIPLTHGSIMECYDVHDDTGVSTHNELQNRGEDEEQFHLKRCLSKGKYLCLTTSMAPSICQLKMHVQLQEHIEVTCQHWLFLSGKLLTNRMLLRDTKNPDGLCNPGPSYTTCHPQLSMLCELTGTIMEGCTVCTTGK